MSNSTNSSPCLFSDVREDLYFTAYMIVTPIHFVFGLSIHILCLMGLFKKAKKETIYTYQIFVIAVETFETLVFVLYSLDYYWCPKFKWCQANHFLMWYDGGLSVALLNATTTTRLLLAVSMAADRVFALYRPFAYKNIKQKRHQFFALFVSISIGILTSLFAVNLSSNFVWDEVQEIYVRGAQTSPAKPNLLKKYLSYTRDFVRMLALLVLITCNSIVIRLYSNKQKVVTNSTIANEKREAQRKGIEKNVIFLTTSQSILTSIDIGFYVGYYICRYSLPADVICVMNTLVTPLLDGTLQVTSTANLYVIALISKSFRKSILDQLRFVCCKEIKATTFISMNRVSTAYKNA
jgi:hypothetical protein